MSKPRLVILSDLWGFEKVIWLNEYLQQLKDTFEIQVYDCCILGNIDKSEYNETNLHTQFIKGGITHAVKQLLQLEQDKVDILAFSIGGTIAWKAQLNGLKINNLYAVSSTRLRYEHIKPKYNTILYFGENDAYKPNSEWFLKMEITPKIIKNKKHNLYSETNCIKEICQFLLNTHK